MIFGIWLLFKSRSSARFDVRALDWVIFAMHCQFNNFFNCIEKKVIWPRIEVKYYNVDIDCISKSFSPRNTRKRQKYFWKRHLLLFVCNSSKSFMQWEEEIFINPVTVAVCVNRKKSVLFISALNIWRFAVFSFSCVDIIRIIIYRLGFFGPWRNDCVCVCVAGMLLRWISK